MFFNFVLNKSNLSKTYSDPVSKKSSSNFWDGDRNFLPFKGLNLSFFLILNAHSMGAWYLAIVRSGLKYFFWDIPLEIFFKSW